MRAAVGQQRWERQATAGRSDSSQHSSLPQQQPPPHRCARLLVVQVHAVAQEVVQQGVHLGLGDCRKVGRQGRAVSSRRRATQRAAAACCPQPTAGQAGRQAQQSTPRPATHVACARPPRSPRPPGPPSSPAAPPRSASARRPGSAARGWGVGGGGGRGAEGRGRRGGVQEVRGRPALQQPRSSKGRLPPAALLAPAQGCTTPRCSPPSPAYPR